MRPASTIAIVATVSIFCTVVSGQESPPENTSPLSSAQQVRLDEASQLILQANSLLKQGKPAEALPLLKQMLRIRQEVHGPQHASVGAALNSIGFVLQRVGDLVEARTYLEQGLKISKASPSEQNPEESILLLNLGDLQEKLGDLVAARICYEEVCKLRKQKHREANVETARALSFLGSLCWRQGDYARAKACHEEALVNYLQTVGEDDARTAHCMNSLASALLYAGELAAARPHFERSLGVTRRLEGTNSRSTEMVVNNLGMLLRELGDYSAARRCFEEAIKIDLALSGGQPQDAAARINLGVQLERVGEFQAARRYLEEGLSIRERVLGVKHPETVVALGGLGALCLRLGELSAAKDYLERAFRLAQVALGQDHPQTIYSLANLGAVHRRFGDLAEALRCSEQSLALFRARMGDNNAYSVAINLNIGVLLRDTGDFNAATKRIETSLEMCRRVLGESHPHTATILQYMGFHYVLLGKSQRAVPLLMHSVDIRQQMRDGVFAAASEAESLSYLAHQEDARNLLISLAPQEKVPADELYAHLWPSRAGIFQVVSTRQRTLSQATDPEVRRLQQSWLDARRKVGQLALLPSASDNSRLVARRELLASATEEKERLERELAAKAPSFSEGRRFFRRSHKDLIRGLPDGAALVDIVRYWRFIRDPDRLEDVPENWTLSYTAFVLVKGEEVKQIDLGPAQSIDAAAQEWREEIQGHRDGPSADELQKRIWRPIEQSLSPNTRTVYIIPDGPLSYVPWAALPGRRTGTVLLEDYALAVVPNGHFLLQQLETNRRTDTDQPLLAVGGVAYSRALSPSTHSGMLATARGASIDEASPLTWPNLPGTLKEVDDARRAAGTRPVITLTDGQATASRVVAELEKARWAVLATHGFFADPKFRSALQLDEALFERQPLLVGGAPTMVAGRNPLLLSGLVLAGANLPRQAESAGIPQGDGGILTAEAIAGLDLSRLELAVLSACETGLGDVAGGEGVFGLQRAFHIAGCRNVVASLWKIDDHATQTLMARFYRNLWEKNLPPLDALREAQLAMYYGYEPSTGQLSRGQGESVPFDVEKARPVQPPDQRRAAPRYWAAFMLSGAGR